MIIEDFDIATDLKVEFLLPDPDGNFFILGLSELGGTDVLNSYGSFVLGTSLLGSTDVLGDETSGFIWLPYECEVSAFNMSVGGQITNATYFQPEAATANITVQSWTLDPNNNKNVRANAKIRVRLDDGNFDRTIFTGYIDTINVKYGVDEPNLINIVAFDKYKKIVNTRIPEYDTSAYPAGYVTPLESLELVANAAGVSISPMSVATAGKIPTSTETDIIASNKLNEAIQVGLGIIWVDQQSEELVFIPRPVAENGGASTFVIGNQHTDSQFHLCMSGITNYSDNDAVFNSLKVSLASNEAIYSITKDVDSIELYGESPIDVTINVLDEPELVRWSNSVFNQQPVKLVKTVTTPAIDRIGNLTEAAVFTPGTLVGVKFIEDSVNIDTYYSITKVSHSVDVNRWFTTLELWKEV